jgi:hypothetical protein
MKTYTNFFALSAAEQDALRAAQQAGKLEVFGVFGDWRKAGSPAGRGGKWKRGSKGESKDYPFQNDVIYRISN